MAKGHHGHEHLDIAVAQKMHREPSNFLWPIGRHGDDPHLRNIVDAIDPSDLHRRARFINPWHRDAASEIATALVRPDVRATITVDLERVDAHVGVVIANH
ncbi:hypothetical protein D3C85_1631120 [compost metagenome]